VVFHNNSTALLAGLQAITRTFFTPCTQHIQCKKIKQKNKTENEKQKTKTKNKNETCDVFCLRKSTPGKEHLRITFNLNINVYMPLTHPNNRYNFPLNKTGNLLSLVYTHFGLTQ
jgi:hypothetical protein